MVDSPRPSSVGSGQSNVSSRGGRGRHDICVGEELKIAVDVALERFHLSEEQRGNTLFVVLHTLIVSFSTVLFASS